MKRTSSRHLALLALVGVCAGALSLAARGQNPGVRAALMREKLEHSQRILDALTREDFPEVAKHASALKALSLAADWDDPKSPKPFRYDMQALEFQNLAEELADKADARNLDGATLTYLQLTAKCVSCHSNIRKAKKSAKPAP